jgi:tetraacyldisaccharide 4'-kinase
MNILSGLYGWAVSRRNRQFDEGRMRGERVSVPVISVGNLSVGGTGKTPFVHLVVRELLALGKRAAVVSRGYGRKSHGLVIVSDGNRILASVQEAGDEVLLHAETLPVPVIADADRVAGARAAIKNFHVDAIVLDDGFQHRRLARDCDIVLLDKATLERPVLLPVGRLREPLSALARADVLCGVGGVTRADIPAPYCHQSLCIEARTEPGTMTDVQTRESVLPEQIGTPLVVSGIARPERFYTSLAERGCSAERRISFADHYRYRIRDIETLLRLCHQYGCTSIVTTGKDAVKLRDFMPELEKQGVRMLVLPIETVLAAGYEQFQQVLASLFVMENT